MDKFRWDLDKNEWLKASRGVSFEEIISWKFVVIRNHPRLAHQRIMYFEFEGRIWAVPCILEEDKVFLKTAFPSRKATEQYRRGEL